VAFGVEFLEEFERGGELGAFLVLGGFVDEAGMAANLPQTCQRLQNGEAAAVHHVEAGAAEHEMLGAGEFFLVQLGLAAAHLAEHVFFTAGGQIAGHLAFGAAQQEGAQTRGEALGGARVFAAVEVTVEVAAIAERTGRGEGHEAPQVEQAVFERCTGQNEAVVSTELARGTGGLRVGVLDLLAFIEDRGQPADGGQFLERCAFARS
jgi:hypothetical protein